MREEVQRISKLVAEGKLSPDDAADLIDAFYASDRVEESDPESKATAGATPPPPPPGASTDGAYSDGGYTTSTSSGSNGHSNRDAHRDPLRALVDSIEKLTKEGLDSVNWTEVSKQARTSAKKGFDAFRSGLEDISKGKVNLGWLSTGEIKEVALPLVIPAGKTLKVENACGDVKVVGGFDTGTATARARFKGATLEDAKAKADAYTLIIEESDYMVLIRQPDISGSHIDLEIQLAGTAPVEIRAETGDIQVMDTGAGCRIVSKTGDIRLRGLNGVVEVTGESGDISIEDVVTPTLSIENKNGDIRAERVRGNINIRTATGDVHLVQSGGKTLAVESVSGAIYANLAEPVTGTLNVRTVNGDVQLGVPDGSDCRVSLSTLRGDVACAIELKDQAKQEQRITGRLGNGTGTLDVSAVTGDVSVELLDAVTA